jgi:hypothetical protein
MSLVASTRGVTLLPAYAKNFLPWSVISRHLAGEAPTIDLVIGYHRENGSPILKSFLSKTDQLISKGRMKPAGETKQPRDDDPKSRRSAIQTSSARS